MRKIKILPLIESIIIALVFFALGRILVIQLGTFGFWVAAGLLIIFYTIWWQLYQRDKKK